MNFWLTPGSVPITRSFPGRFSDGLQTGLKQFLWRSSCSSLHLLYVRMVLNILSCRNVNRVKQHVWGDLESMQRARGVAGCYKPHPHSSSTELVGDCGSL